MHMIVLDCEKASMLVLKREEGKLSNLEKFQLWLHQKICDPCVEFDQQNEIINESMKVHFKELKEEPMPDVLKEKLQDMVK